MRIMSLNGWGGTLHETLLPWLADERPDILCLQEVVHTPNAPKEWLTYRDGDHVLPQRARMFEEVSAALPDHFAVFCPAARGDLWDEAERYDSQWGLATFVHKRLSVIGQHQGFVHRGFSPHRYGAHPRSRSAHAVRIYDYGHDRALTVAHMHGLRDLAGKADTPERQRQAERFADVIRSVAEPDDALIACGDFNVLPGSQTLSVLEGLGLTELVAARGEAGTRTTHYTKPGRYADYMLVSRDLVDMPFSVVRDPEVSDHCPLVLQWA